MTFNSVTLSSHFVLWHPSLVFVGRITLSHLMIIKKNYNCSHFIPAVSSNSLGTIESTSAVSLEEFFFSLSLSLSFSFSSVIRTLIGILVSSLFSFHHGQEAKVPVLKYHTIHVIERTWAVESDMSAFTYQFCHFF